MTFSFAQVEVVSCNTIYSWLFLLTIISSIMTESNALFNGIMGEKIYIERIVPLNSMEASKSSEVIWMSSPFSVLEEML